MLVNALDHVNIVTPDVAGTARFYADLLDLDVRDGPGGMRPDLVQWVYDRENRAIIHVNAIGAFQPFPRDARPGPTTGALHHVALNCSGHGEMIERLQARKLEYAENAVPAIGLKQIFVIDPNNVLIELNFYEA
ncbi:MAG TPA: VOC family protein [Caulobacteraceae bacterium]|nr:VOC family protein [Caulobacteraceae bacterium]